MTTPRKTFLCAFKMSKRQMLHFAQKYKEEEILWNVNLPSYRNRKARLEAMARIAAAVNIQSFGVKEVAQKIKNLRTTYFQEKRRIAASKLNSSESTYMPRVPWFQTVDSFLNDGECEDELHTARFMRNAFTNSEQSEGAEFQGNPHETLEYVPQEIEEYDIPDLDETHTFQRKNGIKREKDFNSEAETWGTSPDPLMAEIGIKEEPPSYEQTNLSLNTPTQESCQEQASVNFRVKPSQVVQRNSEPSNRTANLSAQSTKPGASDEFDLFGCYIASALKSLPYENAIRAQTNIMLALANEKRLAIPSHAES